MKPRKCLCCRAELAKQERTVCGFCLDCVNTCDLSSPKFDFTPRERVAAIAGAVFVIGTFLLAMFFVLKGHIHG